MTSVAGTLASEVAGAAARIVYWYSSGFLPSPLADSHILAALPMDTVLAALTLAGYRGMCEDHSSQRRSNMKRWLLEPLLM